MTLAVALLAIVALSSPAKAAGELRVEVIGGGPIVDLDGFFPGLTRQSVISAVNSSRDDGVLRFRVANLHEDDHGCVRPEKAHGDHTCGDGGGELGRDLTVTVVPLDAGGGPEAPAVFAGSIRDLATWTIADPLLPSGSQRSFRLEWELPKDSPNDTETDSIAFAMEFVLEQSMVDAPRDLPASSGLETDVLSARPSPSSPEGTLADGPAIDTLIVGELPRTGVPVAPLTASAVGVVTLGLVIRMTVRRSRRAAQARW